MLVGAIESGHTPVRFPGSWATATACGGCGLCREEVIPVRGRRSW